MILDRVRFRLNVITTQYPMKSATFPFRTTSAQIIRSRVGTTLLVAALTSGLVCAPMSWAEDAPPGARLASELSEAFEHVAETITPSVVTISTESKPKKGKAPKGKDPLKDFFGEDFFDKMAPTPQRGLGTGVIVDEQGHILTNNHVIGESDEVSVRINGDRTVKAKVVGTDPRTKTSQAW